MRSDGAEMQRSANTSIGLSHNIVFLSRVKVSGKVDDEFTVRESEIRFAHHIVLGTN